MQYLVVVQKLYIAWLKICLEVDTWLFAQCLKKIERFDLLWRESRHLGKTLGRVNVRPCELGGEQPSMPREDRHPIPGILTLWHFPATIDTKWREQYRSKIRSSFLEFVVQRN